MEVRTQIALDVSVKIRGGPKASIVTGVVVRFVLHGKGGQGETIGILAGRDEARLVGSVVGEVRGINLVGVGPRVTVVAAGVVAVHVVVVLPLGGRAPFGAEDFNL